MTDRCDSAARRPREHSSDAASCEPTREEAATASTAAQQQAEREGEARRNEYFAAGTDEGGRSKHASSDIGATRTSTPDDKTLRIINNAKKYDPPIESDPVGNALIGIASGGIIAGVEAGAARGAVRGVVVSAATTVRNAAVVEAAKASARGIGEEPPATHPPAGLVLGSASSSAPAAAGQSKNGASIPVVGPTRSTAPRIPETVPSAPVRIQG